MYVAVACTLVKAILKVPRWYGMKQLVNKGLEKVRFYQFGSFLSGWKKKYFELEWQINLKHVRFHTRFFGFPNIVHIKINASIEKKAFP